MSIPKRFRAIKKSVKKHITKIGQFSHTFFSWTHFLTIKLSC